MSLPMFKGKLRIAKLLLTNKNNPKTFTTKSGIIYKVPNICENVSFELFVNGYYESETVDYIVKNVPENGVFIDVGANIGAISIEVAMKRPDVKIYAFEASNSVFSYLNSNKILNNCANLSIYNLAIHENEGEDLDFFSPFELNGKGSFSPVFTTNAQKVRTKNLDIFFQENQLTPDLIKVDVEGYELTVFKSMSNFMRKNHEYEVLFEYVDWAETVANYVNGAAQSFLIKLGLTLYTFPELNKLCAVQKEGSNNLLARKEI